MRHGIAEEASETGGDRDRRLTSEGIHRCRESGKALRKLGIEFDAVFSSPYPRAWITAEIVAEEVGAEGLLQEMEELEADCSAVESLTALSRVGKGKASVLIVGHEPILSELISILLSGSSKLSVAMRKGAVCKLTCVRPEPGGCRLDWLLTSKQLCRMA